MKMLIMIVALIGLTACGKKSSSSSDRGGLDASQSPIKCVEFNSNDGLFETAVKADQARRDCGLSEEEVLKELK